jgi:hypothetical protein
MEKLSLSSWKGKKHSEETKNKMSRSHIGIKPSEETRCKLIAAKKNKPLSESDKQGNGCIYF